MRDLIDAALVSRVEAADGLDFIAEEIETQAELAPRREQIDDAAADGKFSCFSNRPRAPSRPTRLGSDGRAIAEANREVNLACVRLRPIGVPFEGGSLINSPAQAFAPHAFCWYR